MVFSLLIKAEIQSCLVVTVTKIAVVPCNLCGANGSTLAQFFSVSINRLAIAVEPWLTKV